MFKRASGKRQTVYTFRLDLDVLSHLFEFDRSEWGFGDPANPPRRPERSDLVCLRNSPAKKRDPVLEPGRIRFEKRGPGPETGRMVGCIRSIKIGKNGRAQTKEEVRIKPLPRPAGSLAAPAGLSIGKMSRFNAAFSVWPTGLLSGPFRP